MVNLKRGKKMKKLLLVLITMLLLISCSTKKEEPKEPQEKPEEVVKPEPKPEPEPEPEPEKFYSRFSGLEVKEENRNIRPVLIMIDNHQNARNQANLSEAAIIFEMRVEGEFTRYAALFEKQDDNLLIGPIRSARPNFVSLALQHNALYLHYGGSEDGNAMIYRSGVTDIEGHSVEGTATLRYFDTGKVAPHNAYAYLNQVFDYAESVGVDLEDTNQERFKFNQEFTVPTDGEDITYAYIPYQSSWNYSEYEYNESSHKYSKLREGTKMVDETTNTPVEPTNIIIQIADSYVYTEVGHKAFNTIGSGTGYLLTGGKMIEIDWYKSETESEPTQFTTKDGQPIVLNPGLTWVHVVDSWMDISFE